jgi:hypothetical protein
MNYFFAKIEKELDKNRRYYILYSRRSFLVVSYQGHKQEVNYEGKGI